MTCQASRPWLLGAGLGLAGAAAVACSAEAPVATLTQALEGSLTVQRGSQAAVTDTTVSADQLRKNFGASKELVVSKKNEALLRFDVSAIPPNALIKSAVLRANAARSRLSR